MKKRTAALGSALFFAIAPCMFAGLVPSRLTHWQFQPPFFGFEATRDVGIALILIGLPAIIDSFLRFALQGLGTACAHRSAGNTRGDGPLAMCAILCTWRFSPSPGASIFVR
jgi:heme/copper-type cytochrome/quinol oxidase subunit 1